MPLIDFIEKLQKKPKYVRTQILWLCVSVCMVFVVGIWFITFKNSISNTDDIVGNQESLKEVFSIKESLKTNIKSFFEEETTIKEVTVEEIAEVRQDLDFNLRNINPANLPLINNEE